MSGAGRARFMQKYKDEDAMGGARDGERAAGDVAGRSQIPKDVG